MDILALQQSKADLEFFKTNAELEFEVAADIVETCKDLPYIGSLFKLGKVGVNLMDWGFVRKLGKYLKESADIDENKKNKFINGLSDKDYHRISEYMTHLLYTAEEDGKAVLMGKIYKARLKDEIDDDMMLRLCSIVNKAFLSDLGELSKYVTVSEESSIAANNFVTLGLIDSYIGGTWVDSPTYELNEVGKILYRIIK